MNHRERMVENYEDAVFSLLMDQLADEQGEKYRLLNEELKDDPECVVPEQFSKACHQTINKEFSKIHGKHTRKTAGKLFQRIAVLIAIFLILMTSALALSPSLRAQALNWVLEVLEDRTSISFSTYPESAAVLETRWLPEGYTCTSVSEDNTSWKFENESHGWIFLNMTPSDGSKMIVDTENADLVQEETVRGNQCLHVEKEGCVTLVWNDVESGQVFTLIGESVDAETLLKMAENIFVE